VDHRRLTAVGALGAEAAVAEIEHADEKDEEQWQPKHQGEHPGFEVFRHNQNSERQNTENRE
jgi:hypothetical protein